MVILSGFGKALDVWLDIENYLVVSWRSIDRAIVRQEIDFEIKRSFNI